MLVWKNAIQSLWHSNRFFFCHCSRCRKESGTVHSANLFVRRATLSWVKGAENLSHFKLKGTRKARAFCKNCGSPMPRKEGETVVVIAAGSIDESCKLDPTAHIHYSSRAQWEDELVDIKKFDQLPT